MITFDILNVRICVLKLEDPVVGAG